MGIRTSLCSEADLLQKYVNSSYDVVKRVYDSIGNIDAVSQIVSGDTQISPDDISALADNISAIALVANNIDAILSIGGIPNSFSYTYAELETAGAAINNNGACYINLTVAPLSLTTVTALAVFVNGVYQTRGTGKSYELSGFQITLSEELAPDDMITIVNGNLLASEEVDDVTERVNIRLTAPTNMTIGASTTLLNLSLLDFSYQPGINQLMIYVNGIYQAVGDNYIETTPTSVTLTDVLSTGDTVDIIKIV